MFGLRKSKIVEDTTPTNLISPIIKNYEQEKIVSVSKIIEFPKAKILTKRISDEEIKSYSKVCEELEYSPVDLISEKIRNFFVNENITVYDIEVVNKWMKEKSSKLNKGWGWCPLRGKDKTKSYFRTVDNWFKSSYEGESYTHFGAFTDRTSVYLRLVPEEILRLTHRINKQFGDEVNFYVSDYVAPVPDPFILVKSSRLGWEKGTLGNNDVFVFGFWDEPGFSKFHNETALPQSDNAPSAA